MTTRRVSAYCLLAFPFGLARHVPPYTLSSRRYPAPPQIAIAYKTTSSACSNSKHAKKLNDIRGNELYCVCFCEKISNATLRWEVVFRNTVSSRAEGDMKSFTCPASGLRQVQYTSCSYDARRWLGNATIFDLRR